MVPILLLMLLANAIEVKSYCYSSTYAATTSVNSFGNLPYSNNEHCDLTIIPHSAYRSGYYLEVKWTTFEIEGSMPKCIDYIEVFLTSDQKSIGRYCSGKSTSFTLFNMYSSDGYAKIRFKSDGSITKSGFRFTYQLKSIQSDYIGGYGESACLLNKKSSHYGIFYTSGWPRGYNSGTCYQTITVRTGKEVRIVVMDLDLQNTNLRCNDANDNFQIRGSNSLYGSLALILRYSTAVTERHCGKFLPGHIATSYKYVYLIVNKPFGAYPYYSNKGFMMGYIIYDAVATFPATRVTTVSAKTDKEWGKPDNVAAILGASMAVVSTLICFAMGVID